MRKNLIIGYLKFFGLIFAIIGGCCAAFLATSKATELQAEMNKPSTPYYPETREVIKTRQVLRTRKVVKPTANPTPQASEPSGELRPYFDSNVLVENDKKEHF